MVVQQFIAIKVEILNHLFEVCRLKLAVAILSLELAHRLCVEVAGVATVNAFESGIGLEVSHRRQDLSQSLNRDFLLSDVD